MASKSPNENAKPPSEVSFEQFRKRVQADKKLPEKIRTLVEECKNNDDLLEHLTKAVREIDEA